MEILLLSKGISESAKRSILADEIAQFKKLKEKLAEPAKSSSGDCTVKTIKTYTASAPTGSGLPIPRAATDHETLPPHEAFQVAVEEMKNMIQAEFSAIRAELNLWRKGR
jgi:hypothetical protein